MTHDPPHPKAEALSGPDAAWLRMESETNLMVVNGLLFFDDPLSFDELVELTEQRLLQVPRFTQRVVTQKRKLNRPRWEPDPHFELRAHIHHVAVPGTGEAALKDFLSDLVSQPLDPSQPLWHLYLIEGAGAGNALLTRIHHSLADGFSLLFLLTRLVDPGEPIEFPMGSITTPAAPEVLDEDARAPGWMSNLPDVETLAAMSDPGRMRDAARTAGAASAVLGNLLTLPRETPTSLRGQLGTLKRLDWTRPLPLETIKAIGEAFGGTINDALLLALTSSLRELLARRGEPIAEDASLRIVMPVNLHPLEDRGADLGNGFGLVFLELPVGQPDPKRRLAELKRRLDELKTSPEAWVTFAVLGAMGMGPASAQHQLLRLFHGKTSGIATNVPGPIAPVRFAGRDVTRIMFWVPQSLDVGLGFSIFSYCGQVQLGIQADERLMPDPAEWVDAFHLAIEKLRQDLEA